ncbi:MAG: ThuA domain-containing protein [Bryobacteraceae bacterium]
MPCMIRRASSIAAIFISLAFSAPKMKVLIVDGQNNHNWQQTTPVLKARLEETGLFTVDVATTPPKGGDLSKFQPDFAAYRVVVSNYNGEPWAAETKAAFEKFITGGGGLVSYHAADNSFPEWKEYNQMIALGGWGDRTQKDGPMVRVRSGAMTLEDKPGNAGHHGKRHSFQIKTVDAKDPVMAPLPRLWMHSTDELYDSLRGPAKNMKLLATAYSDPATGGTGEDEPMLFTIAFGKGRIFHTTLGHDVEAMKCVGFIVTLQRGTEWAAHGKVTQKVPKDFPGPDAVSLRP